MNLTSTQIARYQQQGYLLIEDCFSPFEVGRMLLEMGEVISEDCPRRILEKSGAVRSFFAPDFSNDLFRKVTQLEKLVVPARQLLGEEVYIHQTKLNSKQALVGDWWEWHQDYTFWQQDDGMPQPQVLTAMVFLNDVTEFNGPMLLIPGSHAAGVVDAAENTSLPDTETEWFARYQQSTSYMSALTANLKYTLKQQTVAYWATRNGIEAAKGPAGSVLFFHGNVFHASANNLSPWDRHTFLITYNSIRNALPANENPRPVFIANRDFTPVVPLANEALLGEE